MSSLGSLPKLDVLQSDLERERQSEPYAWLDEKCCPDRPEVSDFGWLLTVAHPCNHRKLLKLTHHMRRPVAMASPNHCERASPVSRRMQGPEMPLPLRHCAHVERIAAGSR
jgi:hypothetical protein